MTSHDYLLDNRAPQAGGRFEALSVLFDPVTFRHLDAVGIGPGWRCWEVGAGGPAVPAWMAERVGATGAVLATDIDVSWLGDGDVAFEIRRHDVAADPPPGDSFDVAHARLVLVHVPDRIEALRRIVAAVRPGGWVVIEDFDVDFQACSMPDASPDQHYLSNRVRAGFLTLFSQRGVDLEFGRKLPRLMREAGLVDVRADGYFPLALPAAGELEAANIEQVRAALAVMRLASDDELDTYLAALRAGSLDIASPPLISAWGRVPT